MSGEKFKLKLTLEYTRLDEGTPRLDEGDIANIEATLRAFILATIDRDPESLGAAGLTHEGVEEWKIELLDEFEESGPFGGEPPKRNLWFARVVKWKGDTPQERELVPATAAEVQEAFPGAEAEDPDYGFWNIPLTDEEALGFLLDNNTARESGLLVEIELP